MAFREAVTAEPLDLGEGAFREVLRVAALQHAGDHLVMEMVHAAGEFERRHATAQCIGLIRGEAGANDGDLHRLLLEQIGRAHV